MSKHEILPLLGLCLRAGKLVSGDDAANETVLAGEARLVLLAADAGASVTRRTQRTAEGKNVPVIRLTDTAEALGWALGRTATAVCCITDVGFAAAAAGKAAEVDSAYAPLADQLEQKKQRIEARRGVKKPRSKSAGKHTSGGRRKSTHTKRGGERA